MFTLSYSPRRSVLGFKVDAKLFAVEELVELKLGSGRLGRALRICIAAFHLLPCSLFSYLAVTGPRQIVKIFL